MRFGAAKTIQSVALFAQVTRDRIGAHAHKSTLPSRRLPPTTLACPGRFGPLIPLAMPRRRRSSDVEDIVRLVALLPWWACVLAALVTYLVLHGVASAPAATLTDPKQLGTVLTRTLVSSLAMLGQFVVPLVCLVAAVLSAANRRHRTALITSVTSARAADSLDHMTWHEFELLVGEGFRLQGYEVTELGGAGPDGGVDLILRRDKEIFLVQCKQWKAFKVGVQIVRELYGVMAAQGAAGGFVVTSGTFTNEAVAFAEGRNVRLVDGPKLFALIQQAKAASETAQTASTVSRVPTKPVTPFTTEPPTSVAVSCPACAGPMVRRMAKRGNRSGESFWGCRSYPGCRGTRAVA